MVSLQDYYGNPGLAEYSGTCQITYSGTVLTLPELGRSVDIYNGTGTFQQLTVEGQSLPSGPRQVSHGTRRLLCRQRSEQEPGCDTCHQDSVLPAMCSACH